MTKDELIKKFTTIIDSFNKGSAKEIDVFTATEELLTNFFEGCEEFKIKAAYEVGDLVKVLDIGYNFSTFDKYLEYYQLGTKGFIPHCIPSVENVYKVTFCGEHPVFQYLKMCIIKDSLGNIFIMANNREALRLA